MANLFIVLLIDVKVQSESSAEYQKCPGGSVK